MTTVTRMIRVRVATADDVSAVLEFWSQSAVGGERASDTAGAVTSLIARDPHALLLAVDGDVIVGSLIAGWDGWRCHLYRLAVSPSRRRQGIARLLIDAAEARFRGKGAVRADAMVLDENALGAQAWAGAGYFRETDNSRWTKAL
ncbi:MAG: GNAT family N-acetyltransferase [bacterium]|nr:GNAT family N-acetyltransferase [bacterium]